MELSDLDREVIAEQIKEGNTSGQFSDGEGNRISWDLNTEKWAD